MTVNSMLRRLVRAPGYASSAIGLLLCAALLQFLSSWLSAIEIPVRNSAIRADGRFYDIRIAADNAAQPFTLAESELLDRERDCVLYSFHELQLSNAGVTYKLDAQLYAGPLFETIGLNGVLGRLPAPSGAEVLISSALAVRLFGQSDRIPESPLYLLDLEGKPVPMQVSGIAPAGFRGLSAFRAADLYLPAAGWHRQNSRGLPQPLQDQLAVRQTMQLAVRADSEQLALTAANRLAAVLMAGRRAGGPAAVVTVAQNLGMSEELRAGIGDIRQLIASTRLALIALIALALATNEITRARRDHLLRTVLALCGSRASNYLRIVALEVAALAVLAGVAFYGLQSGLIHAIPALPIFRDFQNLFETPEHTLAQLLPILAGALLCAIVRTVAQQTDRRWATSRLVRFVPLCIYCSALALSIPIFSSATRAGSGYEAILSRGFGFDIRQVWFAENSDEAMQPTSEMQALAQLCPGNECRVGGMRPCPSADANEFVHFPDHQTDLEAIEASPEAVDVLGLGGNARNSNTLLLGTTDATRMQIADAAGVRTDRYGTRTAVILDNLYLYSGFRSHSGALVIGDLRGETGCLVGRGPHSNHPDFRFTSLEDAVAMVNRFPAGLHRGARLVGLLAMAMLALVAFYLGGISVQREFRRFSIEIALGADKQHVALRCIAPCLVVSVLAVLGVYCNFDAGLCQRCITAITIMLSVFALAVALQLRKLTPWHGVRAQ